MGKKSAGNTFPAEFPADSGFQLKPSYVGNCFLRFSESAGNFPAEFPTQNDNETVANVPANKIY
jgi:hypothetical protein